MVAHDPFTGRRTHPTRVERDKDGNATYPNDPHVQSARLADRDVPETKHSGYARGGTTNPVGDDDGKPKWYAPESREDGGVGAEEATPEQMFARDREVNPVPYEGRQTGANADGTPVNQLNAEAAPGETADDGPDSKGRKATPRKK